MRSLRTRQGPPQGALATADQSSHPHGTGRVRLAGPENNPPRAHLILRNAARAIDTVRVQRMLASDPAMAARLRRIVDDLAIEAVVLEGVILHGYIAPSQLPPCDIRTLGWYLRHDDAVRMVRRKYGLPLPNLPVARHEVDGRHPDLDPRVGW